ncbi:MAG TPA: DegT/DnrJ/EryC1/StrS family aminotransferase [Polyangiaceae bacterium]|jgi:dTDP-4-amino-4,6-dideoxygalactose transaminase|nr:DegT/DnrJ/EryC1/StrS family aminotransferase [Polyangiaceae bacterium]
MILCASPRAQYLAHQSAIDAAIRDVLEKGIYIKGEQCAAFEREFATYLGVLYGIGVANGTDALRIAISACAVGAGDEIVTVSHTAVATVSAIEQAGAVPVLVDIHPREFVMDVSQVEAALTPRTKAVVAVHLYGQPVDLAPLKQLCEKKGLWLIEDCAQAHGAEYQGQKVGSIGHIAAFSFYPTKNLGAIGDGGFVATKDAALAERCQLLREYGWAERYISKIPGGNSRLDELQAAILRAKLPHLEADTESRRRIAQQYRDALSDLPLALPKERAESRHVYHLFVLRSSERETLVARLKAHDIQAAIHYPAPVHLQPAYRGRIRTLGTLSATEAAAGEILSLPMYPELSASDFDRVVGALRSAYR